MNNMKELQKLLSKYIKSGLFIKTDEEDWEIDIYKNNKEKNIPSDAIIFANNGCGDSLYIRDLTDNTLSDSNVYVFWHEEQVCEKIIDNICLLLNPSPPKPSKFGVIFYYGGKVKVELGDEVLARDLIFRKIGRVSYLPGISKKHREFEHDGLAWIGITFSSGSITGVYIDPNNKWVKKSVKYLKRSAKPFHEIEPNENLDE